MISLVYPRATEKELFLYLQLKKEGKTIKQIAKKVKRPMMRVRHLLRLAKLREEIDYSRLEMRG